MRKLLVGSVACLAALTFAAPAWSVFAGQNGRLVFVRDNDVYLSNPDGSGQVKIVEVGTGNTTHPVWSPDRQRIAFGGTNGLHLVDPDGGHDSLVPGAAWATWSPDGTRIASGGGGQIYITASNGSDSRYLANGWEPAWSPDGTKIAFTAGVGPNNTEVFTINVDGSGLTQLTDTPSPVNEESPDWSPGGSQIVYSRIACDTCGGNAEGGIWVVDADGTGEHQLTTPGEADRHPSWSPDGSKIAFARVTSIFHGTFDVPMYDVFTMDSNGSNQQNVTNTVQTSSETFPSWEAIRPPDPPGYPRPKGASPVRWPLVPAFNACTSPNRQHGPPLAYGSCAPPQPASNTLVVGTPDVTGTAAESVGSLRMAVTAGDLGTPANDAQVSVGLSITDVRKRSDFSDYGGELRLTVPLLRLTDKNNTTGFTSSTAGTMQDTSFSATVPCAATADPAVGGTCALTTSMESILPGAVLEGKRAVWELSQAQVLDGGTDGDVDTAPNTIFARPGIFVP